MPLATRCPHCETVFRIQPEHLKLHGGLARCGHCQQVFDAAGSLVDPDPELAPAIVEAAPAADGALAQPPRVFSATAPQAAPAGGTGNFTPGAWDMWAPWLDGGIDPKLRHTSENTDPAPLVPIETSHRHAGPANEAGLTRGAMHRAGEAAVAAPLAEPVPEIVAHAEPIVPAMVDVPTDAPVEATPAGTPLDTATTHTADIAALVASLPRDAAEPSLGVTPHHIPHAEPIVHDEDDDGAQVHIGSLSAAAAPLAAEPFANEPEADDRVHFAMTRESPAAARRGFTGRLLGGFVAGLLIVVLAGQIAWWLREPLIAHWPASQPLFAQACTTLGCNVAPPRVIDGLRLGASDLRQLDGPRVLELKVPLSNRSAIAIAWPSIELTLLDASNQVAARRVLAPSDYVHPGTPVAAGLPAGATETMYVRIDTAPGGGDGASGIAASNFRVQIFYP